MANPKNTKQSSNKSEYAVEMLKINKIFGSQYANSEVDLRVKKGTIHGLVGENGAGKTVLMSMLLGLYKPTSGAIKINGRLVYIDSALKAARLGIGMVQQHYQLVEFYKVWQNISVGSELVNKLGFVKRKQTLKILIDLCKKYRINLKLKAKMSSLSVTGHQKCSILQLLYRDLDILIFDEATSILSTLEIEKFFQMVRTLRDNGKTIIFIAHKIQEVIDISDEITVMRMGKSTANFLTHNVTEEQVKLAMFGNNNPAKIERTSTRSEETILEIKNLTVPNLSDPKRAGLKNFSLKVQAGEVVGIAGISDNGQNELYEAIIGAQKITSGSVIFKGSNVTHQSINEHIKQGISFIPEDRNGAGLILDYPVFLNIALPAIKHKPFSRHGLINFNYLGSHARRIIDNFDVRGGGRGYATMRWMSGGNQQKVLVGREMLKPHSLLILANPSRGLDQNSINFIHEQIMKERSDNKAIILISYDLQEIMKLTDRIVVLSGGEIKQTMQTAATSVGEIGTYISEMQKSTTSVTDAFTGK